jgi:hypothetical protein
VVARWTLLLLPGTRSCDRVSRQNFAVTSEARDAEGKEKQRPSIEEDPMPARHPRW